MVSELFGFILQVMENVFALFLRLCLLLISLPISTLRVRTSGPKRSCL